MRWLQNTMHNHNLQSHEGICKDHGGLTLIVSFLRSFSVSSELVQLKLNIKTSVRESHDWMKGD